MNKLKSLNLFIMKKTMIIILCYVVAQKVMQSGIIFYITTPVRTIQNSGLRV